VTERAKKIDIANRLAARMSTDEATAAAWIDALIETLFESFRAGQSVTLEGLGGFYLRPERESTVFKFNPGQRLRALLGWSSTHKGESRAQTTGSTGGSAE
jgi:hypothetical protein